MEIGVCTFAEVGTDAVTGKVTTSEERLRNVLREVALTEATGLDAYAVGEHHRVEFAVSTPAVVLAAAAAITKRIRLSSAVTVLSSDDPVRVFQEFATLDLLSNGRAEIMAGRGSFTESFPLFGQSLNDYDELFTEKLDLLLKLRDNERVTWHGRFRAPLDDQPVFPRPVQNPLPVWLAVGGTPQSVVRAATLGLPLSLAIIGGAPERFRSLVELYRTAAHRAGRDASKLPVGINSHTYIAETSQQARDEFFPGYAQAMSQIGRERGWPPMTRPQFDALCSPGGALLVGTPDEVIEKIRYEHELFGHQRFLAQMTVGTMAHEKTMRSIELLGTVVAPAVRDLR